jgi:hypothetical protein
MFGLAVSVSQTLAAETNTSPKKKATTEKALTISALDNMSGYLRSLDKFTANAQVNIDEVLANGQKIQLTRSIEVAANPPTSLAAKSSSTYFEGEFYFDGKTFTLYSPRLGFYASFDAPATIGEVIVTAQEKYGVEMPLADLFYWGTATDSASDIEEALIVGADKINGVSCNHFAFRQKEIDWQICIQRGDTPLPLKLVITSKDEATQPQYAAILKWDTVPSLDRQSYTFLPGKSDSKISFDQVKADK